LQVRASRGKEGQSGGRWLLRSRRRKRRFARARASLRRVRAL
jgi:hypothetical protein